MQRPPAFLTILYAAGKYPGKHSEIAVFTKQHKTLWVHKMGDKANNIFVLDSQVPIVQVVVVI
uniref:Uncharacterized protein n=1 Tax=Leersia perrieri TaxID=77586 RepID=A0A0D9WHN6_9ORYZ